MSRQVRVSDETYERLQAFADGRPLGLAIERALDIAARQAVHTETDEEAAAKYVREHYVDVRHQFKPQQRNALRCEACGRKKADHR